MIMKTYTIPEICAMGGMKPTENARWKPEWLRSLVEDFSIWLMNQTPLITDTEQWLALDDDSIPTTWRMRLAWKLDDWASALFCWARDGGIADLQSVMDGEIPLHALSDRQWSFLLSMEAGECGCHCVDCSWRGALLDSLEANDLCPECDGTVYLEPFTYGPTGEVTITYGLRLPENSVWRAVA